MDSIKEYLPYIVSVVVAIISGLASYLASAKKNKTDIASLKESNAHEITRLMEQHKLDIDSLEFKHKMEIEKMELEHKHQLEIKNKEAEDAIGSDLARVLFNSMMQTPEAQQAIGSAIRASSTNKRRRR